MAAQTAQLVVDPLPLAVPPHPAQAMAVGVVGAGKRAQAHLATIAALAQAGYYRLVGVCDAVAQRAEEACARYGGRSFPHLQALLDALATQRPAALVVVTPPEIHHPVVELAAARGIHALVETPLSFSLACADRMIAAARRHGTVLETSENVWRFPEERLKRLAVEEGLLGSVGLIQVLYSSGSYHGFNAARHLARAPLRTVSGDVAEMAVIPQQRVGLGGETRQLTWEGALLRFTNGVRGVFQLPIRPGLGNRWEVDGDKGWLAGSVLYPGVGEPGVPMERRTEQREGREVLVAVRFGGPRPVEWENPWRALPIGAGSDDVARADAHLSLHRAAVGAGAADYPGEQGRADLAGVLAIRLSALQLGQPVTLPLEADNPYDRQLHEAFGRRYGFPPEEAAEHLDQVFPPSYPMVRGG